MELVIKEFKELSTQELYEILQARVSVFVVEQTCPYQELDGKDQSALHLYYRQGEEILAYLRLLQKPPEEAVVGRVLTIKRGKGLGKSLMEAAISLAKTRLAAKGIYIEAQTYARGFYEQWGFVQCSDEFLEDGIPHIKMRLKLS